MVQVSGFKDRMMITTLPIETMMMILMMMMMMMDVQDVRLSRCSISSSQEILNEQRWP